MLKWSMVALQNAPVSVLQCYNAALTRTFARIHHIYKFSFQRFHHYTGQEWRTKQSSSCGNFSIRLYAITMDKTFKQWSLLLSVHDCPMTHLYMNLLMSHFWAAAPMGAKAQFITLVSKIKFEFHPISMVSAPFQMIYTNDRL